MTDLKYNLLTANKAKELVKTEYPRNVYLEYMRELNSRITYASEKLGNTCILAKAPLSIVKERIINELIEAGYTVEEVDEKFSSSLRISW